MLQNFGLRVPSFPRFFEIDLLVISPYGKLVNALKVHFNIMRCIICARGLTELK